MATIFMDFDDTIGGVEIDGQAVPTSRIYFQAIDEMIEVLSGLGHDPEEVRTLQVQIDCELCSKYGFGDQSRFGESFVETYLRVNGDCDIDVVKELRRIADRVFDYSYVLLPGAAITLESLSARHRVFVVTKGVHDIQRKKVIDSGAIQYVDGFFVVNDKHEKDWRYVLDCVPAVRVEDLTYDDFWAVGDSVKGDVNTPLRMGLNAIHVDVGGWAYENSDYYEEPLLGRKLEIITHIADILKIL